MKHVFNLTEEEKAMSAAVNRDAIRPVTEAERRKFQNVARNTKTITVRLSERTLVRLKAAAAKEGVPYQTMASTIVQKYVS